MPALIAAYSFPAESNSITVPLRKVTPGAFRIRQRLAHIAPVRSGSLPRFQDARAVNVPLNWQAGSAGTHRLGSRLCAPASALAAACGDGYSRVSDTTTIVLTVVQSAHQVRKV